MMIKDFKADILALTKNGLTVLHCAAQDERGAISLFWALPVKKLSVNLSDYFNCTPLHFAVLNKYDYL